MIQLGLIGYPLSHSLSPVLHAAALKSLELDGEYQLYPVHPDDIDGLAELMDRIRRGTLDGLNVTIPHKQIVIPLLDELTPTAQAIGAVNTLFMRNGRLVGENTDAPGFLTDLNRSFALSPADKKGEKTALVLGAGGGARAVVYALLSDGWDVTLAVRRADLEQAAVLIKSFKRDSGNGSPRSVLLEAEALSPLLNGLRLMVNTTPLGMFPEVDNSPWPTGLAFPKDAAVYDIVFNPRETLFVRQARAAGLHAQTGLGMLVEQAARSFSIWTGQAPPRDVMFASVEA